MKPLMLVGAVVGDKVNHDPQAKFVGLSEHFVKVVQVTKQRIHGHIVTDVIARIFLGGAVEGREPDGINP